MGLGMSVIFVGIGAIELYTLFKTFYRNVGTKPVIPSIDNLKELYLLKCERQYLIEKEENLLSSIDVNNNCVDVNNNELKRNDVWLRKSPSPSSSNDTEIANDTNTLKAEQSEIWRRSPSPYWPRENVFSRKHIGTINWQTEGSESDNKSRITRYRKRFRRKSSSEKGTSRDEEIQYLTSLENEEQTRLHQWRQSQELSEDLADGLKRIFGRSISEDTNQKAGAEQKAFWLIFSSEYTRGMNQDFHGQHFCCWQCDESLSGQRYVLRDDHPYCVNCYQSVFANTCEKCNKVIGIDSKDLSYKDKHWHEHCFSCTSCGESLVDKQFGSKNDRVYCGPCYDQQFASRCDGCHDIFRAGTKKMEYKTRQWHEQCFRCCVCKNPIGNNSFIPREQEIYCTNCYEQSYATRCVKCQKIISTGGVTYKNEPWHRDCFICTNCGISLAGQRFTSRDDKPYCAECFGELFAKRCTACSRPITGIGGTRFISFEDRHWHNDCFQCVSCGTSLVGRGFITDDSDIICPDCAKQKLNAV